MKLSPDNTIEHFLEDHVLPLFAISGENVIWHGDSELNTQSFVYYFGINDTNYLLVKEAHHSAGDKALADSLAGNAIAPHQKAVQIPPKDVTRTYVRVSDDSDEVASQLKGDFSLFSVSG